MNRLTGRKEDGHAYVIGCPEFKVPQKVNILLQSIADKCADIEDILEDTYDLDRLRELIAADKDGRCVVLPVKPGETVRFAKNPRAKREKVACVTLYEDGKISLGFHDVGYKETWVDEWSEDDAKNYVIAEKEADHE